MWIFILQFLDGMEAGEAQTLSQQSCSIVMDIVGPETLPIWAAPQGRGRGTENQSGTVLCMPVDAMQLEQSWSF